MRDKTVTARDVRRGFRIALWELIRRYCRDLKRLNKNDAVVLCDRYITDQLIDIKLRCPELITGSLWRYLKRHAPMSDLAILLTASENTVMDRLRAKGEEPAPELVREQIAAYEDMRYDAKISTEAPYNELIDLVEQTCRKVVNCRFDTDAINAARAVLQRRALLCDTDRLTPVRISGGNSAARAYCLCLNGVQKYFVKVSEVPNESAVLLDRIKDRLPSSITPPLYTAMIKCGVRLTDEDCYAPYGLAKENDCCEDNTASKKETAAKPSENTVIARPAGEVIEEDKESAYKYKTQSRYFTVSEWQDGTALPTTESFAAQLASALRELHAVKMPRGGAHLSRFSDLFSESEKYRTVIERRGISFPYKEEAFAYVSECEKALRARMSGKERYKESRYNRYTGTVREPVLLHNDLHEGNVILTDEGRVHLIDYDNVCYGDPWRDLVYAALFHEDSRDRFWHAVLTEYFAGKIPDDFWRECKYYVYLHAMRMIVCCDSVARQDEVERIGASLRDAFPTNELYPYWYRAIK